MNFSENNTVLPKTQQKQHLKLELQEDAEKQYEGAPPKTGAICVQRGIWGWKIKVLFKRVWEKLDFGVFAKFLVVKIRKK